MDVSPFQAIRHEIATLPESGIVEVINYGRERDGMIPLWAGEGDVPTPDFIVEAAVRSLRDGETFYTYQRGIPELREALAAYHERLYGAGRTAENFFVTASGMQALMTAVQCVVGAGDEVVVPSPAWPNIFGAVQMVGGISKEVPLQFGKAGWFLDVDTVIAACGPKTRAIFVNSPGNPSGAVLSEADIKRLLAFAREHNIWILADEVYGRFSFESELAPSFLSASDPEDKVLVVNTFSKNWAMTGWRTGWIIAPVSLGQVMENLIQYNTSGVPVFLQRGCVAALEEGEDFLKAQVAEIRQARDIVCGEMSGWSRVQVAPPAGAFYLFFKVEGANSSRELALSLIDEANVGLAPGSAFGTYGEGFVRLCLAGSQTRLREALSRLAPVLG